MRASAGLAIVMCAYGCAPEAPLRFEVPWADGEECRYDVLDARGAPLGAVTWSLSRAGHGWTFRDTSTASGKPEQGEVTLDRALAPLRAVRERDRERFEVTYGAGEVTVRRTRPGASPEVKVIPRPERALDDDAVLVTQRALPLATGYGTSYRTVMPRRGTALPVEIHVTGSERVTVPAGTFDAWRVMMIAGASTNEVWYTRAAPHLFVRYRNGQVGSSIVLRAHRPDHGSAWRGDPTPPVVRPRPPSPPRVNVALVVAGLLIQAPLMLLLPLGLGVALHRRYRVGFRAFGLGAATFVASQVVHIPLNYALGLLGSPRLLGALPLAPLAIVAGLSAGLCEELARWVALRTVLRDVRTRTQGAQFGAGHGGGESIIFGVLAVVGLLNSLALSVIPVSWLGLTDAQAAQAWSSVEVYWRLPWTTAVVAGLERVVAIAAHVGLAVLVTRAVARRRVIWLALAVALHAALDAWAVWSMRRYGATAAELGAALVAAITLGVALSLRDEPLSTR